MAVAQTSIAPRRQDAFTNLIVALLIGIVVVSFVAISMGPAPLSPGDVLRGLLGGGDTAAAAIVREIRLPRVLLGLMVGASLGLSGAALQGLLRNPLADPGVIGVSASAGLGAVIAIYFGFASAFSLALPLFAMAGALLATGMLFLLASRDASGLTLILVGIGIASLAVALTSLVMNLAPTPYSLTDMVLWLLGSLSNRSFSDIALAAPFMIAGWALLLTVGRGVRALSLGEETAQTLGIDLRWLRLRVIAGTALVVGASVATCGSIGFIGLVVPHMVRPFAGYDPGRILLPSALGGGLLLVLADIVTRSAPLGQELKLGVVTSLIGSPFFIYLVIRARRAMR
ncbi:MAG: FecCD family ABC transporter permease [Gammaproteobacteria bacterium]